jgi:cholesterol oxidase
VAIDVIVIGSGFGGAVTACRLAEAGYRVLILERGRRWRSPLDDQGEGTPYPRQPGDPWVWDQNCPEKCNGWVDFRLFPNMAVAQGAGVGGGSLIYANISSEAPPEVFRQGWPAEITYDALKPHYDRVARFMRVGPLPENQFTPRTILMREAAQAIGQGERFQLLDLAVHFDANLKLDRDHPPRPEDSTYANNEQGVRQGTCVHLGNCDIGCDVYAKNTLDRNYIPLAEQRGAEVRPLHQVTNLAPVDGGYRVSFDRLQDGTRVAGSETARLVILAAGSLGSTELLLRCRDEAKTLPRISSFLGCNWSSNGDFLTPAIYQDRILSPTIGPTITSAINFLDGSQAGQSFWVEDGGFPDLVGNLLRERQANLGHVRAQLLVEGLRQFLRESDPLLRKVMPWFAQAVDAANGRLRLKRRWCCFGSRRLHLDWDIRRSQATIDAVVAMHERLANATGGTPLVPPGWTLAKDLVTPHPLGGCNMGHTSEDGVVDHRGEVFGYPGLYVADAAIIPRALGVNPSRTIAALAERIAQLIIDRG